MSAAVNVVTLRDLRERLDHSTSQTRFDPHRPRVPRQDAPAVSRNCVADQGGAAVAMFATAIAGVKTRFKPASFSLEPGTPAQ